MHSLLFFDRDSEYQSVPSFILRPDIAVSYLWDSQTYGLSFSAPANRSVQGARFGTVRRVVAAVSRGLKPLIGIRYFSRVAPISPDHRWNRDWLPDGQCLRQSANVVFSLTSVTGRRHCLSGSRGSHRPLALSAR
jgi:hypothetical protein